MLKKTKSILVPIVIIAVIISMTIISVGGKSGYKKRVDAWSGTVKVTYNNEDKTRQVSPIVINGRTYLPLKSVSTLFGKSVTWNNSSKTVAIADTEDSATISQLQNKIIVLEAELAKYEGGSTEELEELAEDLDYEYHEYKDADFEISLKGNEDDINVIIETEKSDWNDISSRNQKSYIQNIVDDILDEFEDANIEGSVRDDSKVLDQFSVTTGGKLKLVSNIDNLEDTLNESLEDDEFGRLDDIDNDDLKIELEEDKDELTFYVYIKLEDDNYEDEWKALENDDIQSFLEDIYDKIDDVINDDSDDDDDAEVIDIEGYFCDDDEDEKLYKIYESSGEIKYKKYTENTVLEL